MLTAISECPRFAIEPPSSMDLRPLGVRRAPDRAGRVPLLVWLVLHATILPMAHVPDIWVVGAVDLVAPAATNARRLGGAGKRPQSQSPWILCFGSCQYPFRVVSVDDSVITHARLTRV